MGNTTADLRSDGLHLNVKTEMKLPRWFMILATLFALTRSIAADAPPVERALRIDRSKCFIDVDVKATVDSFTGHLDRFTIAVPLDTTGKIKDAVLDFKFADLKTGKPDRDKAMMEWLGSPDAEGKFDLGILALAPDGQGQANGKLTLHGETQLVEFPVVVKKQDGVCTVTGQVTIDYRNWGLKKIRKFGVFSVDPDVTIRFQIVGSLPSTSGE